MFRHCIFGRGARIDVCTELLARKPDGGSVDDRSEVLDLVQEEGMEERFVVVAHVRKVPATQGFGV